MIFENITTHAGRKHNGTKPPLFWDDYFPTWDSVWPARCCLSTIWTGWLVWLARQTRTAFQRAADCSSFAVHLHAIDHHLFSSHRNTDPHSLRNVDSQWLDAV